MNHKACASLGCIVALVGVATGQQPDQQFSVRVYDTLLRPIVGANVSVIDRDGKKLAAGVAGEHGLWQTPALDGWMQGYATAPGRTTSRASLLRAPSAWGRANVSLHLFEAVTLRGTVRDDRGQPVPLAHVCVDASRGWHFLTSSRMVEPETRCDGTGQFTLPKVPLADVHIVAWAEGHMIAQKLVVAGDTSADVVLKRGAGRELELQLHGEEVPAGGSIHVQLTLNEKEGMEIRLPAPLREQTLGDKRTLLVRGLPADDSEIRIRSSVEGADLSVSPGWTGPLAASDKVIRLTASKLVAKLAPVSGVLRDEKGAPLPGVTMRFLGDSREEVLTKSDDEGRFEVEAPLGGQERLSVYLKDSDRVLVERDPAMRRAFRGPRLRYSRDADLELVAAPSAVVSGQVKMLDGSDPTGLAVGIEVKREWASGSGKRTEVGPDGRFELRGFAAFDEPFWLVVDELVGSARVGPLRFGENGELRQVEVAVASPTEVRGRVTDADGNPVAGAWVSLDAPALRGTPKSRKTTTLSDRHGRYVLRGARPGAYKITAYRAAASSPGEDIDLALSKRIEHDLQVEKWD